MSVATAAADGSPGVLGGMPSRTCEAAGSETAIASPTVRLRELRDHLHAQAGELEGAVLRQAVRGHSARSADERPEQPSVSARARHERAGVDQGLVRSEASRLGSRRDEVRGLLSGQEPGRPPHQPHAERSSLGCLVSLCRLCHRRHHAAEKAIPSTILWPWLSEYAETKSSTISKSKELSAFLPTEYSSTTV